MDVMAMCHSQSCHDTTGHRPIYSTQKKNMFQYQNQAWITRALQTAYTRLQILFEHLAKPKQRSGINKQNLKLENHLQQVETKNRPLAELKLSNRAFQRPNLHRSDVHVNFAQRIIGAECRHRYGRSDIFSFAKTIASQLQIT